MVTLHLEAATLRTEAFPRARVLPSGAMLLRLVLYPVDAGTSSPDDVTAWPPQALSIELTTNALAYRFAHA